MDQELQRQNIQMKKKTLFSRELMPFHNKIQRVDINDTRENHLTLLYSSVQRRLEL